MKWPLQIQPSKKVLGQHCLQQHNPGTDKRTQQQTRNTNGARCRITWNTSSDDIAGDDLSVLHISRRPPTSTTHVKQATYLHFTSRRHICNTYVKEATYTYYRCKAGHLPLLCMRKTRVMTSSSMTGMTSSTPMMMEGVKSDRSSSSLFSASAWSVSVFSSSSFLAGSMVVPSPGLAGSGSILFFLSASIRYIWNYHLPLQCISL